jgi:hypothetical protein
MKKRLIIKENGTLKQIIEVEVADKEHLQALIKYPQRIYKNKKAYDRKRDKSIPKD